MRATRSRRQWARLAPGTGNLISTPANRGGGGGGEAQQVLRYFLRRDIIVPKPPARNYVNNDQSLI